ncbi:MAG: polysaccharide deacetylase family protein [Sulfuricurvum sp.]|uniref:polysaccharide deacetylase family protein n=1 Tax=Sulfuricurvum sp. TaxID=2025608 RepID=UPI002638D830|nr:polysaccharide deacetylase family protein [Sulfuricurvum sp.]MDD2369533.1 polysaccharide deacetylase family protein [Sulfuricurvum sp.]MDD2950375.1 polysaccharide deacetylase family protein [Sulfuricurvum sp.]MDD5118237.1 polysaccharide deacetylase family protein [Sulfuricurvum sp.]
MTKLFFILTFFFQLALFADTDIIYDIRGNSPLLDANMSQFLDKWRINTVTPVQAGHYKNIIVNGNTEKKNISLTFDDAPDENNTYKLLDILTSHHVKAAFFMIGGTMTDSNITVVKRANDEGHLVLNHTFNHPRLSDLNESAIIDQLDHAATRIETITGHYPILYRPPYGSINARVVYTVNDQGLTTVLWSLDSLDWTLKDPDAVVENVISNIRNGDIILMHRNPTSVGALPKVIEKLREMGYTFLRLDELLGIKAYR